MIRFIRTASTRRLLATIAAVIAVIGGGSAIAAAASGTGPVPPAKDLAASVHDGLTALTAPNRPGISADITFTNNLIGSTNFTGDTTDPILQGGSGRLWVSGSGQVRLELQSGDGDAEILVDGRSFWVSDPASSTVYEGTLPAGPADSSTTAAGQVPAQATIQSDIDRLLRSVDVAGATPTDVAGQPAYTVSVSPKHDGGLLGSLQLAWDAVHGVPLDIAVYARGDTTPVLELKADDISYGPVDASVFAIRPPAGDKVIQIASDASGASDPTGPMAADRQRHHAEVTGVAAVAAALPFAFDPPATLAGLPRHEVRLLDWEGRPAALVTYGENLGAIVVIERAADPATAKSGQGGQSPLGGELSLPTVSINGATGQELDTELGTVVTFATAGVRYVVAGSVPAVTAEKAARALTQ
jgi:outer membrane lipoprotein-sorting protein